MTDAISIIQTVGFPIACVIALGYYLYMMTKQMREESATREERLYKIIDQQSEQMGALKTSIDTLNDTIKEKGLVG